MIEEILPATVAAADAFEDPPDAMLYPEEEQVLGDSVDKRRREFTTARHCARLALGTLGVRPTPVLPGPRGEPLWPEGVVGSMTHCDGYRAAVLGRTAKVVSIGIDAEPNEPLPPGVLEAVSLPEERAWIRQRSLPGHQVCWDRLLFCTKEAVYKTWFPLTKRYLDFEDATITVDPAEGTFKARVLVPGGRFGGRPLTGFTGSWLVRDGFILTAIVMPSPQTGRHD
jgi:4'-phosphopantetheinyl transferase EntD